jgi:hypothetical protein
MKLVTLAPAFLAAVSLIFGPGVLGAPSPGNRVVREGPDGFTLHIRIPEPVFAPSGLPDGRQFQSITVPGYIPGSDAEPGYPDMPQQGLPFGLPEGASARLGRVRIIRSTTIQGLTPLPVPHRRIVPGDPLPGEEITYDPDPGAYRSGDLFPARIVTLGPVMGWRHQRVQSLIVNPVRVAPAGGRYEVVEELEVEVRFEPDRAQPGARRVPVLADAPGWDEAMDRTLLNASSARSFRSRPVPSILPQVTAAGETYLRIRLGGTGLCRIPYADLEAAGWPSGIPVAEVRVEERGYNGALSDPFVVTNLPRTVEDTNANGTFDAGDRLVFYGYNYFDRFPNPVITETRFSYFHTYWVHAGPGGLDFPVVDGYPGGAYAPVTSYPHLQREEKNLIYIYDPQDSGASIYPVYDTFYWLDFNDVLAHLPFTVMNLDPAGTFRLRARWQGGSFEENTRIHFMSLDVNGQTVLDDASSVDRFPFLFDSDQSGGPLLVADYLHEGVDTLTVRTHTTNPLIKSSGTRFDWFEISYDRLLRAVDDRLTFTTGTRTGPLEFAVTGFSSSDVVVLDVTDPQTPFALTPLVEDAGGSYTVRLRVTVAGGTRRYAAAVRASVQGLPPSPYALPPDLSDGIIAPGLPRDLLVEGAGSDYILITHPEFESAWAPLVAHREALGHRVFVCSVWEIYDQFAGGDKTPWAIQRFLTQAYRTWDPSPSFLLLGGDASEDYRTDTGRADPDFVPTLTHFGNVPGVSGLELCATDSWYAAFLREGDPQSDVLPEMNVARIPVGSVEETQTVVQKILDYESMDPGDAWRKRGLFVADDQYSNNILSTSPYCWTPSEGSFRTTTEAVCDSLALRARLNDFECRTYFLAGYLDSAAAVGRNPGSTLDCPDLITTRFYTRNTLTSGFRDLLSQGWLIWEFTGHANATLITHEALFSHRDRLTSERDVDKVLNFEKPFLFMGYACHLMEFDRHNEKVEGESIGENLLLAPNRGAIAVFASTGYEWLHTNPVAQIRTTRPLFWDLERDPLTGRPRRLFGESITRGMAQLILEQPTRQDFVGMIRTYQPFGDPALRVDIHTSAFAVTVDGTEWVPGAELTAATFQDTLSVQAVVSDDVDVSSIQVFDGATELPPGRVTVVPPDSSDQGLQTYSAAFRTTLRLGDDVYDIAIRATDWAGRTSEFTMPVRMTVDFLADGAVIDPNASENPVDPLSTIQIRIHSPVGLAETAFEVFLDDAPVGFTSAPLASAADWELTLDTGFDAGDHDLRLRVSDPVGGETTRSAAFQVSSGPLVLSKTLYFYPNPVEGSQGSLIYTLNRNPEKREAHVSIYAVSGRRVRDERITARAGTNRWDWDLRDGRGDPVANGIYLLVMRLEGEEGRLIVTDGRGRDNAAFDVLRIAVTR